MQNTTGALLLIIATSKVVDGNSKNEIVNSDTEIKVYQRCELSKKFSPGEITDIIRVFEEGVQKNIWSDFQQYILITTEIKVSAAAKISSPVTNLL